MIDTATAYIETFGCGLATADEFGDRDHGSHEGDCRWGFSCGTCGVPVDDAPCPAHAPLEIPGLALVACDAVPRHYSWVLAHDGYEGPCWRCVHEKQQAREQEQERVTHSSRHRAWCRLKAVHWLAGRGNSLGFVKWNSLSYGGPGGCKGCMTGLRFGRSGYLLGWDNWKWATLPRCLRRGHWPAGADACSRSSDGREMNFCVKCSPCPGCYNCQPQRRA